MGPALADDNRGEVDVVGLITHSRVENTKSLLLTDACLSFYMSLIFHFTFF